MIGIDHGAFAAWLSEPGNMLMMVLLIVAVFYHAGQGLQVVIEDYVHSEAAMRSALIASRAFVYVGGTSCLLSVFTIAFGR
jgi:succinate dehydrogenase / fumarate reductase membrane anchor subunit